MIRREENFSIRIRIVIIYLCRIIFHLFNFMHKLFANYQQCENMIIMQKMKSKKESYFLPVKVTLK